MRCVSFYIRFRCRRCYRAGAGRRARRRVDEAAVVPRRNQAARGRGWGKRDEDCANELLLLGECHYLIEDYATARPYLVRAARFLSDRRRMIAEYRLACVAYRLGDRTGAREQIDAFAEKYSRDSRVGTLLLFKMKLLSSDDANAEQEFEALHKRISDRRETHSQSTAFVADKLPSDFCIKTGRTEKAKELYSRIVYQFRAVLIEHERNKQPVSAAYEKSHDHAALELGLIAFREKQYAEATKWLENVRYDLEAKTKARLVLAQVAYESGNFDRTAWYLTEGIFIEFVPVGPVCSDMYLLLGLCEKQKAAPDLSRVEGYLRNVRADSTGFAQAQAALGKLYKERGLVVEATKAYENALPSERYAAEVLFALGELYMSRAEGETDPKSRDELYRKASHMLNRLIGHYLLLPDIQRARQLAGVLRDKGFDITFKDGLMEQALESLETLLARYPETARLAQIKFDNAVFSRGLLFVDSVTDRGGTAESNGAVGYMFQPEQLYGSGHPALTAAGMMVRQFSGVGAKNHLLVKGAELTRNGPPDWGNKDFYYWYYATYAMHNMGGEHRIWWNRRIRDVLIENQVKTGEHTGSWDPKGCRWGERGGRVYTTALGALCLEVYYRYSEALNSFGVAPDIDDPFLQ